MINEPKVSLISMTENPIALMCWARRVMHSEVPDTLNELQDNPEKWLGMSIEDYFHKILMKDGMPTFLEYVNLTFKLENVSRALQQQLTRHRIGFSYSIQSLRCVDLPNFATDGAYYNPSDQDSPLWKGYDERMKAIEKVYAQAIKDGMPTQDARGFLPMNIHSTVTFSCSLRALIGMISKRLCKKTQDEFRIVAIQIVELLSIIEPMLENYFKMPCEYGRCMMQAENEEQYAKGLFKGIQNTARVCPVYVEKFKK